MRYEPHEYQRRCINKMIKEPRLGLFLGMGLGKTSITLTAINEMLFYAKTAKRVLIIAPKKVAETTWSDEKNKWDHLKHLRISKILGDKDTRLRAALVESDIYVINRENVKWLVDRFRTNWIWDTVVIDELSSFKNPKAIRFKKLKSMLPHIRRLYGLTGTPAANGLLDLWSQLFLLDRGERLGKTLTSYRNSYFLPDKRNGSIIYSYRLKSGADKVIRDKISDICLTMRSEEYIELPDKLVIDYGVTLPEADFRRYEAMQRDMILELPEGEITAASAAAVTNKLLQIASGAVYDEDGEATLLHDEKLAALGEIIEASQGEPVLVFYNFKFEKERILKKFPEARELNENSIKAWNRGEVPLLIAHPASSAYGLNLQDGGSHIVWLSPTWNLEQYEQANARLHRQGQSKPVVIHRLIAKDTVDEVVVKALESKNKIQDSLLKNLENLQREYDHA